MQLTTESRRTRWLVMLATWAICAALVLLHTATMRDYLTLLGAQGLRGAAEAPTPLRQVLPAGNADAQLWIRHTLAAMEARDLRVHFTTIDNAPVGREVHWSSSLVWLLRGAHAVQRTLTGQSGPLALERTQLWFNVPLFLALLVAISAWVARRAGAGAGVLIACGMIGHYRFYEGFAPAFVDHHGLINATVLGLLLGAIFMGAGWWQPTRNGRPRVLPSSPQQARHGAIVSALCGATGLWLSTATVAPEIALVGAASLAFVFWRGRAASGDGARFDPELWRLWGRVGAAASFAFYLVEYAPSHFSLRLEVNHPLYALAWWGGAEIVALLGAWWLGPATGNKGKSRPGQTSTPVAFRLPVWHLSAAIVAVCLAPLAVLLGGSTVFMVRVPFLAEMFQFVGEGMSLPAVATQFGFRLVAYDLASTLLLVPAVLVLWRRRDATGIPTGILTVTAAAIVTMAFLQMRWWLNAGTAQLALLLALLAFVPAKKPRLRWRWILGLSGLLFLLPAAGRIALEQAENRRRAVNPADLIQPLYRDIAATLRASQPAGKIVLLASPNASAGIGYFGRFASLGTLYWENTPGLRAAAGIFSVTSDEEAAALLRARGVTHVVMISKANFVGEYLRLLQPHLTLAEAQKTFGYRLGARFPLPRWLQPIPYRRPAELKDATQTVRLYKVAFDQTETDWLCHTVLAELAAGDVSVAEKALAAAAESGRSPAAIEAVERALAVVRVTGSAEESAWLQRWLATQRAHQPRRP